MAIPATIGLLYLIVTSVMVAVAYSAWSHREEAGGRPLVVMMVAATGWAIAEAVKLLSSDPSIIWAAEILRTPLVDITAAGWLYVAVEYTRWNQLKRQSILAVIGLVISVDFVGGITNGFHQLYFLSSSQITAAGILQAEYGILWYAHAVFDWVLLSGAFILLLYQYRNTLGVGRKQTGALIAGMSIGWAASFLNVAMKGLNLTSISYIDPTPFGIAATGVFLLFALFRWEFLNITPVARKTLMESMEDAVIAVDSNGSVIDANPAARELLDETVGVVGEDTTSTFTEYPELLAAAKGEFDDEQEVTIETEGKKRYLDLTISEFDSGRGRIIVIRDITEKRRRQRELEQRRKLEERNERLEEFATVVTHDLRNPLTIAKSHLSFAMEDIDTKTAEYESLGDVDQALSRMDRLTEDLLTLARHGQRLSDTDSLDFAVTIREAWDQTETTTAELTITGDGTIEADKQRLQHLLEHVFRNALEHTPAGTTVRAGLLADGFFIEDDGPGIPPDEREQVLEYGYTTQSGGTGLGLSIVNSIAEAHGWNVTITASQIGGTRIKVVGETESIIKH